MFAQRSIAGVSPKRVLKPKQDASRAVPQCGAQSRYRPMPRHCAAQAPLRTRRGSAARRFAKPNRKVVSTPVRAFAHCRKYHALSSNRSHWSARSVREAQIPSPAEKIFVDDFEYRLDKRAIGTLSKSKWRVPLCDLLWHTRRIDFVVE